MKVLAWIENAVQARSDNKRPQTPKRPGKYGRTQSLYSNRGEKAHYFSDEDSRPPTPALPIASEFKSAINFTTITVLNEPESPKKPLMARSRPIPTDALEKPRFSSGNISKENFPLPTRTRSQNFNPHHYIAALSDTKPSKDSVDSVIASSYNSTVSYISSGVIQPNQRSIRRRNQSSSSIIFQNSPSAPVTIVVTTPEDEGPPSPPTTPPTIANMPIGPFRDIRAVRNGAAASMVSLPATAHGHHDRPDSPRYLPAPDVSRLMPPTENQIDTRRLQKAQEYREIRKFIVSFMNTKGDQFPKKLRQRMMEAYSISDSDLNPEIVRRFKGEGARDEGVALVEGEAGSDAEDLELLQMAFRSQIAIVTPTQEKQDENMPIPTFAQMQNRNLKGTLSSSTQPDLALRVQKSRAVYQGNINRTFSEPNLSKPRDEAPPMPNMLSPLDKKGFLAKKRVDSNPLGVEVEKRILALEKQAKEKQTKTNKSKIFAGTFGAVKDVMSGGRAAREKRQLVEEVN